MTLRCLSVMSTVDRSKLAALVKEIRGIQSQRTFAKKIGVSFASIQSWENGDAVPSTENLKLLASLSGYTLQGLIAFLEDRPIPKGESVEEIAQKIRQMTPRQLAVVGQAVSDRLLAIAESTGR